MQRSVPLHGAHRLLFPNQIFFRFIYWSMFLLALFVRRFSIYIVVGPPTHLQRRSLLKIKIFAMTIVPVTGQCQSALKLVVIIPHALNKRSKEMSRARETLLRSQHGLETIGKRFLFLPSSGRNYFSSRSWFVTITFASGTSFTEYIDVRGTWKEEQGSFQSRNGKCSCGEIPGAETKIVAGGSCRDPWLYSKQQESIPAALSAPWLQTLHSTKIFSEPPFCSQ